MIEAKGLWKQYNRRPVVQNVSIHVQRGEVVGLLGPNGAGKTTTFAMIVGAEPMDTGTIYLDGQNISSLPMYRRAGAGISYLPQEPSVFRKLSVADNIRLVLEVQGLNRESQETRLQELLDEFHLHVVAGQRGYQLSGGERRRTEMARALASGPGFLLMDEPFAGVDPIAVEEIQSIIRALKQQGIGVLVTDHNVRETLRICDRAYILHEGSVLVDGKAADVAVNELARLHYLGGEFQL